MREYRLIQEAIAKFRLDLHGLSVITEAASGPFVWTPLIAACAGAHVCAVGHSSHYGSFANIQNMTHAYARRLNVHRQITIVSRISPSHIAHANIITNTGFVRPLNADKLRYCSQAAAISLMWEPWECRSSDIDMRYCLLRGIPVLGTNEAHPALQTFSYIGPLVKKLLFETSIEIAGCGLIVVGNGPFARGAAKSLSADSARCCRVSSLDQCLLSVLKRTDAIIICDHETSLVHLSAKNSVSSQKLAAINPHCKIIHICGGLDVAGVRKQNLPLYPAVPAKTGFMSATTGYLGPRPVIDLHTAGLKVGEELVRARLKNLSLRDSLACALRNSLCKDFTRYQKAQWRCKPS